MLRTIKRIAHHPLVNVMTGAILVVSALGEMFSELVADTFGIELGAAHGLLTLGLLHVLKSVPDFIDGVDKLDPDAKPGTS